MENSFYGNINLKDIGKGVIIAGGTVLLASIMPYVSNGTWPTLLQLKEFASLGGCAAITYLIKMFLTNSVGSLGTRETNITASTTSKTAVSTTETTAPTETTNPA
jgi:hypothetical protein